VVGKAPAPVAGKAPAPVAGKAPAPVAGKAPGPVGEKALGPVGEKALGPVAEKAPRPISLANPARFFTTAAAPPSSGWPGSRAGAGQVDVLRAYGVTGPVTPGSPAPLSARAPSRERAWASSASESEPDEAAQPSPRGGGGAGGHPRPRAALFQPATAPADASKGTGGASVGVGVGVDGGVGGAAPESAIERVRGNLERLNAHVGGASRRVAELTAQMAALELKKKAITRREELPTLHRLEAVHTYLDALKSMLENKLEEKLLVGRMRQMNECFQRIPAQEKTQQSILDAWNAMFDIHAIEPKRLAKDHCDRCKQPLILIRKQAQLQCVFCATMTANLIPAGGHANSWTKPTVGSSSSHEDKRIKAIHQAFAPYMIGASRTPPDVLLLCRDGLRARSHLSAAERIATPANVATMMEALEQHKYVGNARRDADVINEDPVPEFSTEQVAEVVARFKVVRFVHNFLASAGKLSSRQFYDKYNVNQIALQIPGMPSVAALFPVQKPKRQLRDQAVAWNQLLHYLPQIDPLHVWR
jgi:uncharacterized Zn finger protein (UPF0148 family)